MNLGNRGTIAHYDDNWYHLSLSRDEQQGQTIARWKSN
jgi:hypothetical protein